MTNYTLVNILHDWNMCDKIAQHLSNRQVHYLMCQTSASILSLPSVQEWLCRHYPFAVKSCTLYTKYDAQLYIELSPTLIYLQSKCNVNLYQRVRALYLPSKSDLFNHSTDRIIQQAQKRSQMLYGKHRDKRRKLDMRIMEETDTTNRALYFRDIKVFENIEFLKLNPYYSNPVMTCYMLPTSLKRYICCSKVCHYFISEFREIGHFENLKALKFSGRFMGEINLLPNSIEKLEFLFGLNVRLETETVPSCLRYLDTGSTFNNIIRLSQHHALTHLILGQSFNQSLDFALPETLIYLELGDRFNQPINNPLPFNLEILKFGYSFDSVLDSVLPDTLKTLRLGDKYNRVLKKLPSNLENLEFGQRYNQVVSFEWKSHQSLDYVKFGEKFNKSIQNLPDSVQYIVLGHNFSRSMKKLPWHLKRLVRLSNKAVC